MNVSCPHCGKDVPMIILRPGGIIDLSPKSIPNVILDNCANCGKVIEKMDHKFVTEKYHRDGSDLIELTCSSECTKEYENSRGISS